MTTQDVDEFSRGLLEEAKRFYEKASEASDLEGRYAYLHASLVLGFSAFEAHINSIAEDFLVRPDLSLVEQGLLSERDVKLEDGMFELTDRLKIYRLEDRVQFLYRKFSGKPIDKTSKWWGGLQTSLKLRNKLVHPKEAPVISEAAVTNALLAVVEALDALYQAIYSRTYPLAGLGINSQLTF